MPKTKPVLRLRTTQDRTRELFAELVRLLDAGTLRIDECTLRCNSGGFELSVRGGSK